MLKVLIVAKRGDLHSKAVAWGLKALGITPCIWYWEDFPKNDSAAFWISGETADHFLLGTCSKQQSEPFDVIWLRRRGKPVAMEGSHPDDIDVICRESSLFFDNVLPLLGHARTRWINHPDADHKAKNKAFQLHVANASGFKIPDTLIGNDMGAVTQFFEDHSNGIVHKSFAAHAWDNEDGSRTVNRTSRITRQHLQHEFSIRASPSIYQVDVEKKHELRVTVIGNAVHAAVIDSQRDGPTTDWRHDGGQGRTNLALTELAPELAQRCRSLCRQLDLAYGCIDLIVTPQEDVVFLEINCAGQFLFNEIADPRMALLDSFCHFLVHGDVAGTEDREPILRFVDFTKAMAASDITTAH